MPKVLEHADLRRLLPHGHPMLLVDRVTALEPGVSIVCLKAISGSEPCYEHMTPELPRERWAYPTSLQLESFAQSAAILWFHMARIREVPGDQAVLALAARHCRFRAAAYPGDVMRHEARIDEVIHDHVFVRGETFVEDRCIAVVGQMVATIGSRRTLLDTYGSAHTTRESEAPHG
jgi:3-hydroxyacyl-[acyl-carrier-protein] dehydratase